MGVVGAALTALSVVTPLLWPTANPVWSSVELQFGSAILVFAVLFYVERRFIRKEVRDSTQQLIREMTPDLLAEIAQSSPEEVIRMGEPGGPVDVAATWRNLALAGRYEEAWSLSEPNWQLCRLQAWLYNNQEQLSFDINADMDLCLEAMPATPDHFLWKEFFDCERFHFMAAWDVGEQQWGVASRRRCVGPGYELVVTTPLGSRTNGYVIREPSYLPASMNLLMHKTERGWLLATHSSQAPPQPGWPPAWWIEGDPVAENA